PGVSLPRAPLTASPMPGVGVSAAIADSATGTLTDPSRYLLVGGVVLGLLGVAALQLHLARTAPQPPPPRPSPALMITAAAVTGTLGMLDLGWSTHALLTLLLAGLAVPMT